MALTKRYVTSAGAGAGTGLLSDFSDAMSWAAMITDLNTPHAGYKYVVKGNVANTTTSTTLTGDGTTTSPIIIEGCFATEGDMLTNGRNSDGTLNTTGFPVISYTGSTARFIASGANNLIIRCLTITAESSNLACHLGAGAEAQRCRLVNSGTNSASYAVGGSAASIGVFDCDVETALTGTTAAVQFTGGFWHIEGCRIKCAPGNGISCVAGGVAKNNTIYECTVGIATTDTASAPLILNNTIVNCTGNGIDIITGTTGLTTIIGNSITGCGGYGIDFNSSTCVKRLGYNRFRDNTSGDINGGGDWEEGTSILNVTTDSGSTATNDAIDFTDVSNDDYSLKAGAPQTSKGIGHLIDIGAHGSPVVIAGGGPLSGPGRLVRN